MYNDEGTNELTEKNAIAIFLPIANVEYSLTTILNMPRRDAG